VKQLANSFKISLAGLMAAVVTSVSAPVVALDNAWESSTNPATKERYIPVELWAGAEWDGKKELKMPKVDGTYRHRKATYQIKGPMEWEHPTMGRKFLVYERINPGKDGTKWQLFTINEDQNGLGRLYDGRPGRDGRLSSGGLKFPLACGKKARPENLPIKYGSPKRQSEWNPLPFNRSILFLKAIGTVWNFTGLRPAEVEARFMIARPISIVREKAW
jgi:hypothetical protein